MKIFILIFVLLTSTMSYARYINVDESPVAEAATVSVPKTKISNQKSTFTIIETEKPVVNQKISIAPILLPLTTLTVTAGSSVKKSLEEGATKAGWQVVWKLSNDWISPATTTFSGAQFQDVASDVIKTLSANGAIIHAQFFTGNKTMVVVGAPE